MVCVIYEAKSMKTYGMRFIDNSNINSSCLNTSKLHVNKSARALLTKHFEKIVNSG